MEVDARWSEEPICFAEGQTLVPTLPHIELTELCTMQEKSLQCDEEIVRGFDKLDLG